MKTIIKTTIAILMISSLSSCMLMEATWASNDKNVDSQKSYADSGVTIKKSNDSEEVLTL